MQISFIWIYLLEIINICSRLAYITTPQSSPSLKIFFIQVNVCLLIIKTYRKTICSVIRERFTAQLYRRNRR